MILQSTPVLFVESIGPSEAFFEKLGFQRTVSVPETGEPGFIIMSAGGVGGHDGIGVMLQTVASLASDLPGVDTTAIENSRCHLFMAVADLDAAARILDDVELLFPRRDTFYGATEIGFVEPGGHTIVLAQFAANSPDEA